MAIYEEEEELEDDDAELGQESFLDDSSSNYSGSRSAVRSSRNDTMLLAQFLSTTGPEEYGKQEKDLDSETKKQQFKRASRLLSRLRKRPTLPVLRSAATTPNNVPTSTTTTISAPSEKKLNYIPLPVYDYKNAEASASHSRESVRKASTASAASAPTPNLSTTISSGSNISTHLGKTKRQSQRDSGVYSETNSERDSSVTSTSTAYTSVPPLPFTTVMSELQFPHPPYALRSSTVSLNSPYQQQQQQQLQQQNNPRRPAPLPPAVASAAIATATSVSSSDGGSTNAHIRSVPEAALKRRSVRLRHVQVQTTTNSEDGLSQRLPPVPTKLPSSTDGQACPHCRQCITPSSNRNRRPSCPPALSSGPILAAAAAAPPPPPQKEAEDSKVLLEMIMSLKSQLEEEKQCRLKLEKAIHQRQSDDKREQLAREKDKWAGACLWLNDRIALLPE
ncbi:hypothetical protein [Parasitella parasitica]|uniref:Uncharacterized protein n=1 Tax=Parasitella parasitica TaxID=35722 RepID=A0A0B7N1J3_9FUNG|nr:hypothetical protein [Parasitella parasitica]